MFNKIKNLFDRMGCDIEAIETDPDKKLWESPALMTYLKDYPNVCSMKNFRALEILQDNRKLTKDIQVLSYKKQYSNQIHKEEVKELLDVIFGMSRHNGDLAISEFACQIMKKHGFEVTEDGFVVEKGEGSDGTNHNQ